MKLYFSKVRDVKSPSHGTPDSAGYDFYVPNFTLTEINELFPNIDQVFKEDDTLSFYLQPSQGINIPSGIHVNLGNMTPIVNNEYKVVLLMDNKSGVCSKNSVIVGANTIDQDYQGEMWLHILNVGDKPFKVTTGEKLVQGKLSYVLTPQWEEVDIKYLYDMKTQRGDGGFGSTGLK